MLTTLRVATTALVITAVVTSAAKAQAQTSPPAAAPVKLAYVNTETLMAAAPGRAAAQASYEKDAAAFQTQQKKWSDSLDKLISDFQKVEPTLTAAKKKAKQDSIQSVQTDLQAKNLDGQQKLQTRQNELLAPLMEMVKKAIDDIRVEDGYTIIFSGDANSPIVSADKNLDITDRVMGRLKTMAAKAPAAPSAMAPSALIKKPPTR